MTGLWPEGCGGGFAIGHAFGVRVDGPLARRFRGFVSLTAFQAEGYGIALRAILIKSALRDWLSMSYGMIRMLMIGSLRSPPPIRLRRTFPHPGDRINRSMLSCRDMAPFLNIHSAPSKRGWQRNWIHRGAPRPANPVTCFPPGKVVAPATKGGMHFLERSEVGLFSLGRKPGCKGFIIRGRLL